MSLTHTHDIRILAVSVHYVTIIRRYRLGTEACAACGRVSVVPSQNFAEHESGKFGESLMTCWAINAAVSRNTAYDFFETKVAFNTLGERPGQNRYATELRGKMSTPTRFHGGNRCSHAV